MIRNDFVSNSSSSSFILSNNASVIEYFNITVDDLINVVADLFGSSVTIYNLTVREGLEKAKKDCLEILNEFDCDYSVIINDEVHLMDRIINVRYNSICESLKDIYNLQDFGYGNYIVNDDITIYDRETKTDVAPPKFVIDLLKDVRKRCGIVTNGDILLSGEGSILVHGDYCLPLEWDKKKTYADSLCEMIFNKLVEKGKINPYSVDFLNKYFESDNVKRLYSTYNGINYNYEDFKDEMLLAFNNHEG
jgi:hypothetical protein